MFKSIAKYSSVLFIVGVLTACAGSPIYHKMLMRGQIVGVEENEVVLCIGSKDGAEIDQTLKVYRIVNENRAEEKANLFKRVYTGEVVIGSVIDEHFARASVSSGDVKLHDVVELDR